MIVMIQYFPQPLNVEIIYFQGVNLRILALDWYAHSSYFPSDHIALFEKIVKGREEHKRRASESVTQVISNLRVGATGNEIWCGNFPLWDLDIMPFVRINMLSLLED